MAPKKQAVNQAAPITEAQAATTVAKWVSEAETKIPGGFTTVELLHKNQRGFGQPDHGVVDYIDRLLRIQDGARALQHLCFALSWNAGWHNGDMDDHVPTKLALIHSEISEALEGHRKEKQDEHLPHRSSVEVELADAVIRIMDLAGAMKLDLAGAIVEKLAYNQVRQDHRPEVRAMAYGKKY